MERWPVRTLRQKISGMHYERTALSKNTEAVIKAELDNLRDGKMTPDMVCRDPYLLELGGGFEASQGCLPWVPVLSPNLRITL
jgi:predicted nuclease of restriction endonuclease-like (RecB) superfamily